MKRATFLCLCLLTCKTVFALQCLTTDLATLREKHEIVESTANCNTYFERVLKLRGKTPYRKMADEEIRCFRAVIYVGDVITINGCIMNGGCVEIKKNFEGFWGSFGVKYECKECDENSCNAGREWN